MKLSREDGCGRRVAGSEACHVWSWLQSTGGGGYGGVVVLLWEREEDGATGVANNMRVFLFYIPGIYHVVYTDNYSSNNYYKLVWAGRCHLPGGCFFFCSFFQLFHFLRFCPEATYEYIMAGNERLL